MVYPIGEDRILDEVTGQAIGTEPLDIRRWIWSLYRSDSAAIVRSAGAVSGLARMAYQVPVHTAYFPTGDQEAVIVTSNALELQTAEAPSSGSRTEHIYMSRDGVIHVGAVHPAGTALLDTMRVPANITGTNAATSLLGNRMYAPLYGASMGELIYWKHGAADLTPIKDAQGQERVMTTQTLTLDSDRRLDFLIQTSLEMSRNANVESWGWKKASFLWSIWIDGVRRWGVELGVEEFAETKSVSTSFPLTAGTYKIELRRERRLQGTNNPTTDLPLIRDGGSEKWPGTVFKVVDIGQVK